MAKEVPDEDAGYLLEQRLGTVVQLALTIPLADVQAALATHRRQAAVQPLLDPTRFIRDGAALDNTLAVLEAFAAFRAVLEERRAR